MPPKPPPLPPIPPLEAFLKHGVTHIRVWCGRWPGGCTHEGMVPLEGSDLHQTIVEFAAKLRCEKCGTVGGQALPEWPHVQGQGSANSKPG